MIPPLALLAKEKGLEVIYYTKPTSQKLKENPTGNFEIGQGLITFVEISNDDWDSEIEKLKKRELQENEILIHQGGLQREAEMGVQFLCDEIVQFAEEKNIKDLNVFLPSGTGATALFLQKNLPFRVFTTPCVGDKEYLLKQFLEVELDRTKHPVIIDTPKKYHFAKPYPEFLKMFLDLKRETGVTFDLLYDPKGWITLDLFRENIEGEVLYIHQGGILGNSSQLDRYKHKNLLKI